MSAGHRPRSLLQYAVADDLTGAVEAAAALSRATTAAVLLADGPSTDAPSAQNTQLLRVLDLDVRHAPATDAYAAAAGLPDDPADGAVFVKVDSLLRGSPGSMVAARTRVAPTVVCPALPAAGRATVDGRLRVTSGPMRYDGTSLRQRLSPAELLPAGLEVVRGPRSQLCELILDARGRAVVCDAETAADLDRVAALVEDLPGICLVGSGGLAAALGRLIGGHDALPGVPPPLPSGPPVLAVVGSAEESARFQVERLERRGGIRIRIDADLAPTAALVRTVVDSLGHRPVALTIEPTPSLADDSDAIAARLAATVAAVIDELPTIRLFLTGGHTARTVLDALGVRRLDVVAGLDVATVHCRTDDGREVVTRPGSLGGPDALAEAVEYLGGAGLLSAMTTSSAPVDASTEGSR